MTLRKNKWPKKNGMTQYQANPKAAEASPMVKELGNGCEDGDIRDSYEDDVDDEYV